MQYLSRRDFLKLAGALSAGAVLPWILPGSTPPPAGGKRKNVIVILFDAMSAGHLSVYGYPRETSPNLARFAEKATVYHSHYSGSNFTSPGTASLLTGLYPWGHRAITHSGMVRRSLASRSLFHWMGADYLRTAYGQNPWADVLLSQFAGDLDRHLPPTSFSIKSNEILFERFANDQALAQFAFEDDLLNVSPNLPGALLAGYLKSVYSLRKSGYYRYGFPGYPRGIPVLPNYNIGFKVEDVFDGVAADIDALLDQEAPFLSYYHFYSPHEPYQAREEFVKLFRNDDYRPEEKPKHPLAGSYGYEESQVKRALYDRYVANVDADFGMFIDHLREKGVFESSYVIVTSDHGELFERGDFGHGTALMYEDVTRIPLLISAPGQSARRDFHAPTSNVDVLPTLVSIAGADVPSGLHGRQLPGLGGQEDSRRAIYSMVSLENSSFLPLTMGTIAMWKGSYKLISYLGYPGYDGKFEFYDLGSDPQEMQDLAHSDLPEARSMREELRDALNDANRTQ